jgi:hypothetical protein
MQTKRFAHTALALLALLLVGCEVQVTVLEIHGDTPALGRKPSSRVLVEPQ